MNISDFERLLREGNTPRHFPPAEDKWRLLEKDLERKRRGGIIVLPKKMYWAAAASAALLISIGFYALRDVPAAPKKGIVHTLRHDSPSALPADLPRDTSNALIAPKALLQPAQQRFTSNVVKAEPPKNASLQAHHIPADSVVATNGPKQEQVQERQTERKKVVLPENRAPLFDDGNRQYARNEVRRLNFGVSAFYGFSGIAKEQYRVSVDAKRNLSKRVFASVQLVASTAKLSANSRYQYQAVSLGAPGAAPTTGIQETEAEYSGSVYNVGLTPSIGFRLTRHLSVSAGPDVQKNVAGSVALINKDIFRNQINNESLIDEQQEVADLDLGVQSTAQISVSSRLSFNLLYRYGFTEYLKKNTGNRRNSLACIGLSYNLK